MVERQLAVNRIDNEALLAAFGAIERHHFTPPRLRARAYGDCNIPLGRGRRVMPSPLMVARLFAAVLEGEGGEFPFTGKRILIACAGSGYSTLLARKLGAEADYAESDPILTAAMRSSFAACGVEKLPKIVSTNRAADPYDYIILEASVAEPPRRFRRLLKPKGKLAAVRCSQQGENKFGEVGVFAPSSHGFSYRGGPQGWLPAYVEQ